VVAADIALRETGGKVEIPWFSKCIPRIEFRLRAVYS